jgi:hypothetical protein
MADDADLAGELVIAEVAAGVARARQPIPAGVPGTCENCGEDFARLVDGQCGFCRDGRRPRFDRTPPVPPDDDEPEAVPVRPIRPAQEPTMPPAATPAKPRTIAMPAEGALLAAIEKRARDADIALGRAALELAEHGLEALNRPAPDDAPGPLPLADVHVDALFAELQRRFAYAGDRSAELAAIARADVAEARLARLREAFAD